MKPVFFMVFILAALWLLPGCDTAGKEAAEAIVTTVEIDEWEPMWLIIPAIDLDLEVSSDVGTYDREEFGIEPWKFSSEEYSQWIRGLMPLLNEGPVHYQFSALPNTEDGNVVIAGHSPGPWYHFYDLDLLESGDEIYLETGTYRFVYIVQWHEIVDQYEWSLLFPTDYPALTFQTCHPKDSGGPVYPYRLMVRAELKEVRRLPD